MQIPFNKPYLSGKELEYIQEALRVNKISGNGIFTKKCHDFFKESYGFKKCLLTTSCTDALEMAAILFNIREGDEVIIPSFTFVSTANAFILRGAKIVFCDSREDHPGMDEDKIESLITPKTKAIVPVHYAGVACDMDKIMDIASRHDLYVIEDAAHAIDSYYKGRPLGSIGHLAAFSFHETKNVISGEGGMLVINDDRFIDRAEIIWEKGTNRAAFWRGEVDRYGWVDVGSSFLPSELIAAFLYAQLENLGHIQKKRLELWHSYVQRVSTMQHGFNLPVIPEYAYNNAHMFYLVCEDEEQRTSLIDYLKSNGIGAVFHYQSLHKSLYYRDQYDGDPLDNCDNFTNCLVRMPLFYRLTERDVSTIVKCIEQWLNGSSR